MRLADDTIVITGIGMVSSLGLDAVTSCASARAAFTYTTTLKDFQVKEGDTDELEPLQVHAVPVIADGFTGLGRLVQLGQAALSDLLSQTEVPQDGRTGFFVNLPSNYFLLEWEKARAKEAGRSVPDGQYEAQERQAKYTQELIPRLKRFVELATTPAHEGAFAGDQAGFHQVILRAAQGLKNRQFARCIVGGIDSAVERYLLTAFQHFGVLKTPDNPDGFMPGEAAAFVLLERADEARQRQAPVLGVVQALSGDTEPFHRLSDQPAQGVALTRTIQQTLQQVPEAHRFPERFIGNLNGDAYRAMDWGYAQLRLQAIYGQEAALPEWYPAVPFGEIGAATGPVALCMGVRAFARGYAGTNHLLIWLASEDGARAALSLHQPLT